ncbi:hypothetical protein BJV82DRAFT_39388 [Fennellomyces sp. T-0311]|nr:hypothetical protein BJV82DRAFT_39388 [Fennellomyces sp. T-0311]
MEDDIVDFEDFDYNDLGDVNPDDLDIENLERELGLLNEEASSDVPKSDAVTQPEPEADKKPENDKKVENDKKAEALGADESAKATQSKEEEKPMKTVNKQSGTKPTYTSSGPPKRAPFVPHSAASFPQYPFVHQGMMGMNMMMPPMPMPFQGMPMMMGYPPRPMGNKIHINPKFAAMQQQQQQQQQQPRPPTTNDVTQEEIDRQRQHLLEMQRKRQAEKAANAAHASPKSSEPVQQQQKRKLAEDDDDREHKRPFTIKGLSKGITIKGAAAAAELSTRKPPGGILDRISSPSQRSSASSTSILDRISSPGSPAKTAVMSHLNGPRKRGAPEASQERPTKKPTSIPITTKGTSCTLIIKNLSESTTQTDLKELWQSGSGVPSSVHFNKTKLEATVTYKDQESAVIMRRRYNRTSFKGSHITISFL